MSVRKRKVEHYTQGAALTIKTEGKVLLHGGTNPDLAQVHVRYCVLSK